MSSKEHSPMWSGWVAFAALMMMITGAIGILMGIVAVFDPHHTVVVENELYVVNLRGWGILVLAFGVLLVCAGVGILSGRTWARVVAIVAVSLHAISQLASLAAYPLWSLLMLGLDVAILYALTAAWSAASQRHDYNVPTARDPRDEPKIWEQHPRTMA